MNLISEQYALIRSSRSTLFQYCDTVALHHLVQPHPGFGSSSMRDLLFHIAQTYFFWIGEFGLKKSPISTSHPPEKMIEVRNLFQEVDQLMLEFMDAFGDSWDREISGSAGQHRTELRVTALKLFTHVTTHEFHHKGQILSISRMHGYAPVDTDVIRF